MKFVVLTVALACVSLPARGAAYTVTSGFADPCHEDLTIDAFSSYAINVPPADISPTDDPVYQAFARNVRDSGMGVADKTQELILISMLIGVRSPDTDGHGLLDLETTRRVHAAETGQYIHALREADDDGPQGDRAAIDGMKTQIRTSIKAGLDYGARPQGEQFIDVPIYVEHYGVLDVEVWAPAYFFGRALHTVQDSFSHSIRSDDFRQILHVMNYVEAIRNDIDEERDGIPHSESMDSCDEDTAPVYDAAGRATVELMRVMTDATNSGQDVDAALDAYFETWMVYRPGCTTANNYCDSEWVDVAKKDSTGPYLSGLLGCSTFRRAEQSTVWLLLAALLLRRRSTRKVGCATRKRALPCNDDSPAAATADEAYGSASHVA